MPRTTFDIFISSTSEDLQECRQKVKEVIIRCSWYPVQMELFGSAPYPPLDECRKKVESCDFLIVIVGRRYGWVPTKHQKGNGVKSITWLEVEWAIKKEIPVYAYLLDPKGKLFDDIRSEKSYINKALTENITAQNRLQSFQEFLKSTLTITPFISPSDLAIKVAVDIPKIPKRIIDSVSKNDVYDYFTEQNIDLLYYNQPNVNRNDLLSNIQRNQEDIDKMLLSIYKKHQLDKLSKLDSPWQLRTIEQIIKQQPNIGELAINYKNYHTILYTELVNIDEVSMDALVRLSNFGNEIYQKLRSFSNDGSFQV